MQDAPRRNYGIETCARPYPTTVNRLAWALELQPLVIQCPHATVSSCPLLSRKSTINSFCVSRTALLCKYAKRNQESYNFLAWLLLIRRILRSQGIEIVFCSPVDRLHGCSLHTSGPHGHARSETKVITAPARQSCIPASIFK